MNELLVAVGLGLLLWVLDYYDRKERKRQMRKWQKVKQVVKNDSNQTRRK